MSGIPLSLRIEEFKEAREEWVEARRGYIEAAIVFQAAEKLRRLREEGPEACAVPSASLRKRRPRGRSKGIEL
jgi:hypothetical protein